MRILGFLVALGAVFGIAWAVGNATGEVEAPEQHEGHASRSGYEVVLEQETFEPGRQEFAFRIERDGRPVTSYDVAHEKLLHLIVVKDDFTGFQHLHPTLDGDTWRTDVALRPGTWNAYADFTPAGDDAQVLATSLDVPGTVVSVEGGQARRVDLVDGYVVELKGRLVPGGESVLRPEVSRDSTPITDLEPYLGAQGHLVALRHDTYDYLHVHPEGLDFHTTVDKPGTYELFLQFQHEGAVHTAQFTLPAEEQPAATPTGVEHGEHGDH